MPDGKDDVGALPPVVVDRPPPAYEQEFREPPPGYDTVTLSNGVTVKDQPVRIERRTGRQMSAMEWEVEIARNTRNQYLGLSAAAGAGTVCCGGVPICWGIMAEVLCATIAGSVAGGICCVVTGLSAVHTSIAWHKLSEKQEELANLTTVRRK